MKDKNTVRWDEIPVEKKEKTSRWIERYERDDPLDFRGFFRRRFYCPDCKNGQSFGELDYCPMCGSYMGLDDSEAFVSLKDVIEVLDHSMTTEKTIRSVAALPATFRAARHD